MSVSETEVGTSTPRGGWTSLRWRLCAAALVLIVTVGAGIGYWRWRDSASILFAYGSTNSGPLTVGETMYVNTDIQPDGGGSGFRQMDVHRVTPRLTANTAHAGVTILTCDVASPYLGMGMGTNTQPCARVAAFHPGPLKLGFPATELIYKITPTQAGAVRIEGADVGYSVGGRNGTQHAGSEIVIRVASAGH